MKLFFKSMSLLALLTFMAFNNPAIAQLRSAPVGRDQRIRIQPQNQEQTQSTQDTAGPRFLDLKIGEQDIRKVSFSPDGKKIITEADGCHVGACGEDRLMIWDAESGKLLQTLKQNLFPIRKDKHGMPYGLRSYINAISSDGKKVVTKESTTDGGSTPPPNIVLREADSGRELHLLVPSGETIHTFAAFSPDSKKIVMVFGWRGSNSSTAQVWNAESGKLLHTLSHVGNASDAAFSPDGKTIITTNRGDKSAPTWDINDVSGHVWDAESGKKIATLTPNHEMKKDSRHQSLNITFSPDGRKFAVHKDRSDDATFIVSEFGTDKTPITLTEQRSLKKGDSFRIESVKFSPDGKKIVTCGRFHSTRGWGPLVDPSTVRIWFLE